MMLPASVSVVTIYVLLVRSAYSRVQGISVNSYNGTTTLDEQASYSVESPDRTVRFPYRPNILFDSASSGGHSGYGVYVRPPPGFQRPPALRPPYNHHHGSHHHHHSSQLIAPPHPPKYYPVEPGYAESVYDVEPDCSVLAPLLALKASLAAVFKLVITKLPVLAVKLFVKAIALLVVLGPLLLPLVLLFPVPVFAFAGFNGFGNGIAVTGFGNNGVLFGNTNNNGVGNNLNNNGVGNNLINNGGNRFPGSGGRQAILARLPQFARGPCLPRLACEMGYWGYRDQVAWILNHATETMTPTFPKMFEMWKRAYSLGGKGRDCASLYFCPTVDKLLEVATQHKLIPD